MQRLRAYLKALPDFEDIDAEARAAAHALGFKSFSSALYFFVEWPDLAKAAQLVLERGAEIDGNAYYLLDPAARLLEGKHPLAATILRRGMIEDTLERPSPPGISTRPVISWNASRWVPRSRVTVPSRPIRPLLLACGPNMAERQAFGANLPKSPGRGHDRGRMIPALPACLPLSVK